MMAIKKGLLSTSDNPWNPWTDHQAWNTWDMENGYHTLAYLGRIIESNSELSQADQDLAYDLAVEEILEFNLTGNYIVVEEPRNSVAV